MMEHNKANNERLLELKESMIELEEQLTMAQLLLSDLVDRQRYPLSAPQVVAVSQQCIAMEYQTLRLEEEYQALLGRMEQ
jgi:phosphoribosyl-dephospho-CoA transferase